MVNFSTPILSRVEDRLSSSEKLSLQKIFNECRASSLTHKHSSLKNSNSLLSREDLSVHEITDRLKSHGGSVLANNEPFYLVDLGVVVSQFVQWRSLFGHSIRPHYAVKCNPNPYLIKVIHALGGGFDCASKGEIDLVVNTLGLTSEACQKDILFANPCKQAQHILFANTHSVKRTTFDSPEELVKIKRLHPEAEVILRIKVDDSDSLCQFSSKFGAPLEDCPTLISLCLKLKLNLVGVSFHVGSGCQNATAFVKAAEDALSVFSMARSLGLDLKLLDIGGGFPGDNQSTPSFEEIVAELYPVLEENFISQGIEIVAEPGRYFAAACHTLATNIFSKKVSKERRLYYINDGVYQCFNCLIFDHAVVQPIPVQRKKLLPLSLSNEEEEEEREIKLEVLDELSLTESSSSLGSLCDEFGTLEGTHGRGPRYEFSVLEESKETKVHPSTVFGPTCDSLDTMLKAHPLPEMQIGDWFIWKFFGAYTISAASSFNGMEHPSLHYVSSLDL